MIAIPAFSERTWKIIGICAAALVLLGFVLFGIDRCSSWRFTRDIDKRKVNVNAALSNIAEREKTIANLNEQQAAEKEAVKIEAQELQNAVNATNEQRVETNRALENLNASRNSNAVNVSVSDLEEKLRRLDQ